MSDPTMILPDGSEVPYADPPVPPELFGTQFTPYEHVPVQEVPIPDSANAAKLRTVQIAARLKGVSVSSEANAGRPTSFRAVFFEPREFVEGSFAAGETVIEHALLDEISAAVDDLTEPEPEE